MRVVSTPPSVSRRDRHSGDPRLDGAVSPPAQRRQPSRWRDPRLWLGVLLVLASIAVGARVFAAADDTVAVWQLKRDIAAGLPLTADDLTTTQVHFDDSDTAQSYLRADQPPPAEARLARAVSAGELLSTADVTTQASEALAELPVGVEGNQLPADLAPGQRVAVWAVADAGQGPARPRLVLEDVLVLSVGSPGPGGSGSQRPVLLQLPGSAEVSDVLAALSEQTVTLVRTGR